MSTNLPSSISSRRSQLAFILHNTQKKYSSGKLQEQNTKLSQECQSLQDKLDQLDRHSNWQHEKINLLDNQLKSLDAHSHWQEEQLKTLDAHSKSQYAQLNELDAHSKWQHEQIDTLEQEKLELVDKVNELEQQNATLQHTLAEENPQAYSAYQHQQRSYEIEKIMLNQMQEHIRYLQSIITQQDKIIQESHQKINKLHESTPWNIPVPNPVYIGKQITSSIENAAQNSVRQVARVHAYVNARPKLKNNLLQITGLKKLYSDNNKLK